MPDSLLHRQPTLVHRFSHSLLLQTPPASKNRRATVLTLISLFSIDTFSLSHLAMAAGRWISDCLVLLLITTTMALDQNEG